MRMCRQIAAAGLLALFATPALAQHPQVRKGFWINFGIGYGSADLSCDGCGNQDREGSATAHVRLGGTLRPNVLLGGEIDGWAKETNGADVALGSVLAAVYYYPMVQRGFFLKGGAGFSSYVSRNGPGPDVDGNGWALMAGLGYDVRVGRNISLTPEASWSVGGLGDLENNSTTIATGATQNVLALELGITFH